VHGTGVSDVAFRSEHVRGVLYHRTEVDPDIRYPPYSENQSLHKTAGEMLWSAARIRCACDPGPALERPGPAPALGELHLLRIRSARSLMCMPQAAAMFHAVTAWAPTQRSRRTTMGTTKEPQ
jgi:hypothetical protein